jgi:hypothetical protein
MASSADTLTPKSSDGFAPVDIARNDALTAREKIDLLRRLRAELTGEHANPEVLAFDIAEIDRAIEEVRRHAREGTGQALRRDR